MRLAILLSLKIEPRDQIRLSDPDVPAQPDKRDAPALDQVVNLALRELEVFGNLAYRQDAVII